MNNIAEVIPLIRLPRTLGIFDYLIPQELKENIKIGQAVSVPFRYSQKEGIVVNLKKNSKEKKLKKINKIITEQPMATPSLLEISKWMSEYYALSPALILKSILPSFPKRRKESSIKQERHENFAPLTVYKSILPQIKEILEKFNQKNTLIHYEDNKSKAVLLLKIIEKIVKEKKQILLLEPQITDLPPLYFYLKKYFPYEEISIFYRGLSKTILWQEWWKIKENKVKIIIGTRSAIFTPLSCPGLIVIDQEESPDYKQYDQNPRYHARQIAERFKTRILLLSQAPGIESFYQAKNKNWQYFKLNNPSLKRDISLIDINNNKEDPWFLSYALKEEIIKTLEKKRKVLLLLNRRGSSTLFLCHDCKHIFKCPQCKIPMVYHKNNLLICHQCDFKENAPLQCPNCQGANLKKRGIGTQKVEEELKKIFKEKILRIDKDQFEKDLKIKDAEIIIATEYFLKYYFTELNNFFLIGLLNVDLLFHHPDFRALENAFIWLTKINNIAKENKCKLIIQTYSPHNFVLQSVLQEKDKEFYNQELKERKKYHYPPFTRLIKLIYRNKDKEKAKKEAFRIAERLKERAEIYGPLPSFPEQIRKQYQYHIILKKEVKDLGGIVPDDWIIDRDPLNI